MTERGFQSASRARSKKPANPRLTGGPDFASFGFVKRTILSTVGLLLGSAAGALAQQADAAAELRRELDTLRSDYEQRINRLEKRIKELETDSTPKPAAKQPASRPAPTRKAPKPAADPPPAAAATREAQTKQSEQATRKAIADEFNEDTEIRDIARRPDADRMLADRIEDVLEGYLDITGYFRAGYGRSDEGGSLKAFGIPGV